MGRFCGDVPAEDSLRLRYTSRSCLCRLSASPASCIMGVGCPPTTHTNTTHHPHKTVLLWPPFRRCSDNLEANVWELQRMHAAQASGGSGGDGASPPVLSAAGVVQAAVQAEGWPE